MRGLVDTIRTFSWLQILSAAALVAFSTLAFIYLAVYAYVVTYPVLWQGELDRSQLSKVAALIGDWGARAFFLAIAVLAASQVVRRVGESAILQGVLVGVLAAALFQFAIHFLYPPVEVGELSIYLALGVVGGWLGNLKARNALAGQEALYHASQDIGRAHDSYAVAAAIGEHLGGSDVGGVSLWRAANHIEDGRSGGGSPQAFEFWTSWTPRKEALWPSDARIDAARVPALAHLVEHRTTTLRIEELPFIERAEWASRGLRVAFLVPLVVPGNVLIGLLMIAFRKTYLLSQGTVREYLTIATQAALALENLRLLEGARAAGKQTGVLIERQRLSREIHDTLTQGFAGIVASLRAAKLTKDWSSTEESSARWYVKQALDTAGENLNEARRLVWALRPEVLDHHPLPEALRRFTEEWAESTGVKVHVIVTGVRRLLPTETQAALLRTAQEALSNVRKHARASQVTLTLSYMDNKVVLDILDDGIGFVPDLASTGAVADLQNAGGFGLLSIRERVEQLNGMFLVESVPGKGTVLVVELPMTSDIDSRSSGQSVALKPESQGTDH